MSAPFDVAELAPTEGVAHVDLAHDGTHHTYLAVWTANDAADRAWPWGAASDAPVLKAQRFDEVGAPIDDHELALADGLSSSSAAQGLALRIHESVSEFRIAWTLGGGEVEEASVASHPDLPLQRDGEIVRLGTMWPAGSGDLAIGVGNVLYTHDGQARVASAITDPRVITAVRDRARFDLAPDDPYGLLAYRTRDELGVLGLYDDEPVALASGEGEGEIAVGARARAGEREGLVAWIDRTARAVRGMRFVESGSVLAPAGAALRLADDLSSTPCDLRVVLAPADAFVASWRECRSIAEPRTEEPRWVLVPSHGLVAPDRRTTADDPLPADAFAFAGDGGGLAFSIERTRHADGSESTRVRRGLVDARLQPASAFEPIALRTRGQVHPSVASRGGRVLAAWRRGDDVMARIVGDDASEIAIGSDVAAGPVVAATTEGWLVAWASRDGALLSARLDDHARFVADSRLLLPDARRLAGPIAIAERAEEQLLVGRVGADIVGVRYVEGAPSGAPFVVAVDPGRTSDTFVAPATIDVASDGRRWLVVWESDEIAGVRAAFVDAEGRPSDPFVVPAAGGARYRGPGAPIVEHAGGRFLVAWLHTERYSSTHHTQVRGRTIDAASGAPLGTSDLSLVSIATPRCTDAACTSGVHTLALASDGVSFALTAGGRTGEPLRIVRLDREGLPIEWAPARLAPDGSPAAWDLLEDAPQLAASAGRTSVAPIAVGRYLVVHEEDHPEIRVSRLRARRVHFDGGPF